MADLIERYKITANLPSVLMNYCNRFNSKQLESITEMIYELENSIESADVQPIRHGRWDFQGYQLFKCTNCKEMFTQDQLEAMQNHKDCEECTFPNFCPNCGARMDLGDEKT